MRFPVDAQLPRRLCGLLRDAGHDALHTLDLPLGNRTPDAAILDLAECPWRGSSSQTPYNTNAAQNCGALQSGFTKFCPLDSILKKLDVSESTGNSCA